MTSLASQLAIPARLTHCGLKHKVSSVLNRSSEFSSKHMFDGRLDTCWNSDQGSPQFILMDFGKDVTVTDLHIMFQGGFSGADAVVQVGTSLDALETLASCLEIADSNDLQTFPLQMANGSSGTFLLQGRYVQITFPSSTDFYGRVTIYQLEVDGY